MVQRRGAEGAEDAEGSCNALSERVIGAAIEVHRCLGPGLLESAYETCLCREFQLRGIRFERQRYLDVDYKGMVVKHAFRVDLIVEDRLLVELKSLEAIAEVHQVQLLTYLRVTGLRLGLIVNFNTPVPWRGVKRVVNSY